MIQLSSRPVAANAAVTDNNHNYLITRFFIPILLFSDCLNQLLT